MAHIDIFYLSIFHRIRAIGYCATSASESESSTYLTSTKETEVVFSGVFTGVLEVTVSSVTDITPTGVIEKTLKALSEI